MRLTRLISLGFLLATSLVHGQTEELSLEPVVSVDQLQPGQPFELAVIVELRKPWHINANPAVEGFIPTELEVAPAPGVQFGPVQYPVGDTVSVGWSEEPVALYSGRVVIRVGGRVDAQATPGSVTITGALRYQACNDEVCFAPTERKIEWPTRIGDGSELPQAQHSEVFSASPVLPGEGTAPSNSIESLIAQRGWVLALIFVFLGGLALNLTPCVYPMIAITVSYFGGQGEKRIGAALARSVVYCLGIVLTYSVLGVIAALTGGLFGALLQSPVVLIAIAVLMVLLALSMFGLYELRPPSFLVQKAAGMSSQAGLAGVFLLGATVGVIAAPCLAPILVALLAFVGQRGDPWLGWWMFFTLALGLGVPYIILGTFSGLLSRLPKSGTWMVWVKRVFGVLLLIVAAWFVLPLFKVAGKSLIPWQPYSASAIERPGRPVLIDFYADWCIPCREMDRTTFRDERVAALAETFLTLKADLTRTGSPEVEQLTRQFNIVGVPTYVFLSSDGREYRSLRKVGFVRAGEFLETMRAALEGREETSSAISTNSPSAADIPPQLLNPF